MYPRIFDFAATRNAIGSAAIWRSIESGGGPTELQALMTQQADAFLLVRQRYLRY
jgi:hypothetical protein